MTLQQALSQFIHQCENSTDEQIETAFNRLDWQSQETIKDVLIKAGFLLPEQLQQYEVLLILRKIAHHFALSEYLVELILKQNLNLDDMVRPKT